MTHYMNHSLQSTRRVVSSIITHNFLVTRNKQPMTIGTNQMCISRDDNCANTMCFPRQLSTTARKLFTRICFRCFLGRISKLPFSFLFLSMSQLSKYVSIKPCQGNVNGRKSYTAEGFNVKIPFISQTYTKAVAISFRQSHTRTCYLVKYHPRVVFTESFHAMVSTDEEVC